MTLPCPVLTIRIEVPADGDLRPVLRALPARPGVFLLEDGEGRTIQLAVAADLRRRVRSTLAPPAPEARPSRRADLRTLTRTVRGLTVGSPLEADWACLQLARVHLPATYRSLLDRWRGWFIHADPLAPFPRFVKTSRPSAPSGVHLGPFADKHAAQRSIELLQDAFDLCRYHHLLVEAPDAAACAYKEMGRCPAPCDGSVSMDAYRRMIDAAIEFAGDPAAVRSGWEHEMREASGALAFERAERCRQRLETMKAWLQPSRRFVDRLERFRYLAVLPSERADHARLVLILGGWIEPWADVPIALGRAGADEVRAALADRLDGAEADLGPEALENVGLVCWHLFRPAKSGSPQVFEPIPDGLGASALTAALRRLGRHHPPEPGNEGISETSLEGG